MKNFKILTLFIILLITTLFVGCISLTTPVLNVGGGISGRSSSGVMVEKIIFSSNRDGNYEVYIMDPDGSNQQRLTDTPGVDGAGDLSPDGTKITFYSKRDGNCEVYIMNVDGSNQENLTNNLSEDGWPSFSPDGTQIVFHSNRSGEGDIYIMNADGSNQTRLTDVPGTNYAPSFSPDGSQIVFTSRNDLYIMNVDGSNISILANIEGSDAYARFSPDGSKIVFNHCEPNWHDQVYIMDADGSNIRSLTTQTTWNNMTPRFSPDGSKIVFGHEDPSYTYITVMDTEGNILERLTNNPWRDSCPVWGYVVLPSTEVPVPLDIKPGSCPNPINVKSQGVLPVAVLGTADFDVNQIDPASITLEGVSPLRWDLEDVSTPFEPYIGKTDCEQDCNILGPDGIIDLTFKFDTQEVLDLLGDIESYDIEQEDLEAFESGESDQLITTTEDALLDGACLTVTLTGTLTDGTNILGEDLVLILRKGK